MIFGRENYSGFSTLKAHEKLRLQFTHSKFPGRFCTRDIKNLSVPYDSQNGENTCSKPLISLTIQRFFVRCTIFKKF